MFKIIKSIFKCIFGIIKGIVNKFKNIIAEKKYNDFEFERVTFGSYPQNDPKVAEPIEWLVIRRLDDVVLLMSDKILHTMPFDLDSSNYSTSLVHDWLNGEFFNVAFSESEKERMGRLTGENDKVAILNQEDVMKYLPAQSLRPREVTNVAKRNKKASRKKESAYRSWMLRSPSDKYQPMPAIQLVDHKGKISPMPISSKVPIPWGVVPIILILES